MTWLMALDPGVSDEDIRARMDAAASSGAGAVVIPPHKLHLAQYAQLPVLSTAGWPSGNHAPLIKASEARLAVQSGAEGVLAMLDQAGDESHFFAEVALLSEAVPEPAGLWIVLGPETDPAQHEARATQARAMGVRGVITTAELSGCGRLYTDTVEI
ncbi:deoxyribose-phosphate aldolase [Corynebacterium ciconiae DSM 44920]|uniref:hypothetical protein n=1 Tax=Corynebacterium ciconiae TaxID=227319 RepID=UPI0003A54943|nr:hypothetical protein [Corynebacterium ciconiae]WKD62086.1 deoxyribose-phosphate aldolase [Corynebacterium ciconiae DSM 44920]